MLLSLLRWLWNLLLFVAWDWVRGTEMDQEEVTRETVQSDQGAASEQKRRKGLAHRRWQRTILPNADMPSLSSKEDQRAEVLAAMRFHERYLQCDFAVVEETEQEDLLSQRDLAGKILRMVDLDSLVLLPGELVPLVESLPVDLDAEGKLLVVSTGRWDEQSTVRKGTLARVVAEGTRFVENRRALIIQGIRNVSFKVQERYSAQVISIIQDYWPSRPGFGYVGEDVLAKIIALEKKSFVFSSLAKDLPISEMMRFKLLKEEDALSRSMSLLEIKKKPCVLFCGTCYAEGRRTVLSPDARRLESKSTCVNPGGYVFNLLCFEESMLNRRVVNAVGLPVAEHSWFEGFQWSFAICNRCGGHLGWRFMPTAPGTRRIFWGIRSTEFLTEHDIE